MEYLGDKLTVAQSHVSHWVGSLRRSLQEALNLVTTAVAHDQPPGEGPGRAPLRRTSSFRRLASRSRESFRSFSVRSHHRLSSLRKRQASSEQPHLDQLKQCFGRPPTGDKDTDTLVPEADSQYGTWSDQRLSGDSPCSSFAPESPSSEGNLTPARRRLPSSRPSSSFSSQTDPTSTTDPHDASQGPRSTSLDRLSTDVELSAEGPDPPAPAMEATLDFSFLEQTSVLDSSALKTRVQLSKRRRQQRAPLSHSLRRSALHEEEEEEEEEDRQPHSVEAVVAESAWMFRDSTGEKLAPREELEGEGKPPPSEKSPFSPPPRLPVFPGMDHSALKAQLRKRHEPEGTGGAAPAQPSRAPKSPFQAGLSSGRMFPLGTEKEEWAEEPPSPQWLKALRTKKRQSQYEPGVTPTA